MFKYLESKRVKPSGDIELTDRLVGVQRVTKVTKGGRAFGFSAIVVVGNGDGVVVAARTYNRPGPESSGFLAHIK